MTAGRIGDTDSEHDVRGRRGLSGNAARRGIERQPCRKRAARDLPGIGLGAARGHAGRHGKASADERLNRLGERRHDAGSHVDLDGAGAACAALAVDGRHHDAGHVSRRCRACDPTGRRIQREPGRQGSALDCEGVAAGTTGRRDRAPCSIGLCAYKHLGRSLDGNGQAHVDADGMPGRGIAVGIHGVDPKSRGDACDGGRTGDRAGHRVDREALRERSRALGVEVGRPSAREGRTMREGFAYGAVEGRRRRRRGDAVTDREDPFRRRRPAVAVGHRHDCMEGSRGSGRTADEAGGSLQLQTWSQAAGGDAVEVGFATAACRERGAVGMPDGCARQRSGQRQRFGDPDRERTGRDDAAVRVGHLDAEGCGSRHGRSAEQRRRRTAGGEPKPRRKSPGVRDRERRSAP